VSAGARDRKQVALTFHVSGERALAVRMLDLLHAHGTTITAFIVGSWLDANTDMTARFIDGGHELANHTYTHPTFPSLTRAAMTNEIAGCRDSLVRLAGTGGRFFRPSGTDNGTDTPAVTVLDVARAAGYSTVVGFDVDPADYKDPGAKVIATRTIDAVLPGSIVSLHFGHQGTIDALPAIFSALDARGLQMVDVSTLLTA
jgi:peptidoglycan/xylan/chitin deacetylase (PgdA/CDA1 family)